MQLSTSPLSPQSHINTAPMAWIIELLTFLAVITVLNIIFFPGDFGFLNITPHPLWLAVLPIAVRYGFTPGMTAGVSAAAMHVAINIYMMSDPTWSDISQFSVWKTPFLFLITGIILGETREIQKQHYYQLLNRHRKLRETANVQHEKYTLLQQAKEELDLRIITQQQSLSVLYESARNLRHLDEDAILPALLELLREHLDVQQAAAYSLTWSGLIMASHIGPEEGMPETLPVDEGLFGLALSQRKTVTIREVLDRTPAGPQFLIVAPVLAADQVKILGVLAVRDLPFTKFTSSGVRMLSLLADWGGTSLDNAQQFAKVKDQLITDEDSRAYTFSYFQSRITEEINRCRRYQSIFSLLCVEFPLPEDRSEANSSIQAASFVIIHNLRVVDIVFRSGRPERLFVMLPATNREGAEHVARKLQTSLEKLKVMSLATNQRLRSVRVGIAPFEPGCDTPRAMIEAATKNLTATLRDSQASTDWSSETTTPASSHVL
jgi:hypothetical protein